jgi:hypothetical protein
MADNDPGAAVPNTLDAAATATQGMIPGQVQGRQQNMTAFGPAPMVQPPPIPRFQAPQPQFAKAGNEFQTVSGRKRADRQTVISGAASLIKSGTDYIQAKKQRALSMDIQTLMEASQGRTEAQQVLQAPDSSPEQIQEAQKALETNTNRINDITKDPKKSKQLQKAFNVDLFGGGKNKAENQAMMTAWQEYNKKQQEGDKTALNPTAQKLIGQQPQRLGLGPQAQAQAAAIKAGVIPGANKVLQANVDMYKSLQTAKSNEERTAAIQQAAQIRADAEKYHADKIIDAANVRALGVEKAAEIRSRAEIIKAQTVAATWDKRINALTSIANDKNLNEKDKTILGSLSKEATIYNTQIKTLIEENLKIQAELDKKGSSLFGIKFGAANDADSKLMRQKIGMNNMAIKMTQKSLDETQNKIKALQQMGIITMSDSEKETDESPEVDVNDDEIPE